jgi:uncharacterized protein with HEPN domain
VPPREWRVRVNDIIDAAERAVRYTDGLTFDEFRADARTVDAVSFAIVIVGEAANAVPESVTRTAPEIPWTDIRGMRNKIARTLATFADGPHADASERPLPRAPAPALHPRFAAV